MKERLGDTYVYLMDEPGRQNNYRGGRLDAVKIYTFQPIALSSPSPDPVAICLERWIICNLRRVDSTCRNQRA